MYNSPLLVIFVHRPKAYHWCSSAGLKSEQFQEKITDKTLIMKKNMAQSII